MATTRFWKITNKLKNVIEYVDNDKKTSGEEAKSSDDIASTLHYATNERKTLTEEKLYVTSINCEVKTAAEEFEMVKKRYGKGHKILGYHGYMSFKEGEVTPDKAHMIGVEFAKRNFPGFQVVVATHLNTNHIHNHFVVNSVCMKDGHMAHDEVQWFMFHHMVDAIMREHSLSYIRFPKRLAAVITYDKEQQRDEIHSLLEDINERGQHLFELTVTVVHTADSLEELDAETESFIKASDERFCRFSVLKYNQYNGLQTTLPWGLNAIDFTFSRTMNSDSMCTFTPFFVRDIEDENRPSFEAD